MASLEQIVGHFTPLTVSGSEWHGACLQCDGALAVIGDRWRCSSCSAHDAGDDAAAFLVLAEGLSRAEAEAELTNGRTWEPALSRPVPPPKQWGLHRLADDPRTALICDTREAAKAVEAKLPGYATFLWPGGGSRWDGLEPLRGRVVLLWPSIEGLSHMERLEAVLADPAGLGCTGSFIVPSDLAPWDAATDVLIAWAKERKRPLTIPDTVSNPAQQVAAYPPSSEGLAAQAEQSANVEAVAAIPPATPAPADAGFEPPPLDFPPDASLERPRKRQRHLRAVDSGNLALAPDEDAEPVPVEMGEDQLSLRFAVQHGEDWRYVKKLGIWFHWDGVGWRRDETELIDRLAVEFCRQAANWPEAQRMTPASRQRIAQRRTAGQVRDGARHDRQIAATVEQWDSDPLLIGVPGGAFCVASGKLIMGEREHYVTKRCSVAPAAGKPKRWLEHLHRMMEGDASMVDFLHSYAGYCATGDTSEQVFAFLYGLGQTGKGTFLLTVGELLGDYAVFSEASTFLKRQGDKHLAELARFMNARMVIIDEVPSGSVWNEERIKRCTGGGKLTVNFMHMDPFDMPIKFKLAVAGNSKPQLRRVGKEMQRRIRLVRCNSSIPDEEVNQNFRAQIIAEEGPQILNWIFDGAMNWHREGLPLPEQVSDATREYLESVDVIGDWLTDCTDQSGEVSRPTAYASFKAWFQKQGNDHAWGPQAWWSAMEDRGYTIRRTASERIIKGLSLKLGANL